MPQKPCLWCAQCGAVMHKSEASLPQGQAHCRSCRKAAGMANNPRRLPALIACLHCGEDFRPRVAKSRYCSIRCSNRRTNAMRVLVGDEPTGNGGGSARTRARRWGLAYQHIDPQRIYKRDRWRCQLCGEKVDKGLSHPDPMSASIDHVVPMACGGGHVPSNVQLAHLRCNISKGARGDHQLAMPMHGAFREEPRAKKVKPQRVAITCPPCGVTFVPTGKRKYCTPQCQLEHNARSIRERYRARAGLPPTWDRPVKRRAA